MEIRVGTSGFSFLDWRGTVYPKALQPKDALQYYERELGLNFVEINSTYYTLVSDKSFKGMSDKTGASFEFVVKGYKGTTHDPFDPRLGNARPSQARAEEDTKKFIYSIGPLIRDGKLGGVLLQFPVFFQPTEESREYLLKCKEWFENISLIIEFRHSGWAKNETFEFLRLNNMAFCVVDEPKLSRLMPFINEVTADIGYLRLHGRNKNWFSAPAAERYDYKYSDDELKSFIPEVQKITKKAKKTFVSFNNCHVGKAALNAIRFKEILKESGLI